MSRAGRAAHATWPARLPTHRIRGAPTTPNSAGDGRSGRATLHSASSSCPGSACHQLGYGARHRRWVADSTRADTRTDPSPRFQYDWWTRPGSGRPNDFWAQGNHGQFVYVAPSRDVVLVRFGTDYNDDTGRTCWPTLARRL